MSYESANDEIQARIKVFMDDETIVCVYPDVAAVVPNGDVWARVTIKWVDRNQRGFRGNGPRKYTATGVLCVELYCRIGDGRTAVVALGNAVVTHLENTRLSSVWYRNIRAVDVAGDGSYSRVNVLAQVSFDDHH